jgi:2-methylcitrate dehydratase
MDEKDKHDNGAQSGARRRFLAQVATTGAAAGAAAALPAIAQNNLGARVTNKLIPGQLPLSETFARYAFNLKYEDIPPEVARTAKRIILDTIGCAIGGHTAGPAQIAQKLAANVSAKQAATIMCTGQKTTPEMAVFANGVMIRYLDFNDGYINRGSGHPSDALAALLTPAELYGRSGKDLIVAMVLAYEVFGKIMDIFETRALGLDQSTVLGLASVVGIGKLMGLTQQQLTNAIGITVGANTAINQGRVGTLSNFKSYACADASRKAIFSAELAQAGMTGPREVFEGRDGFFNVISRTPFTIAAPGSEPYGVMRAFTKRFALGQYSQTVAQAAMEARAFYKDPAEIAEINLHVSKSAIHVMAASADKWRPQTHETADHSMPYSTGVVLMYGKLDEDYYEDPYLHDEKLLDLVAKVKVIPSDEADRRENEINLCDLELVLKSGQRKTTRVEYHRGHWKNPMTDAEMEEKFRGLAHKHLKADRLDALLKQLWALENMPKAGAILGLTRV